MFQSSSTASGICRRQASSACSPSSASAIWNSRPSRIRRATLRITLESSTTKQFFITSSHATLKFHVAFELRNRDTSAELEHPIEIEHHHKPCVQPMYAGRYVRELLIEIDGIVFAARGGQLQD